VNTPAIPAPLAPEQARAQASAPWPRPRPLSRPVAPVLDLSVAIPPGLARFREFCTASAEALQFPPDAVAPLAVALVSIGTARACEVELAPQWRETAPLWFCALLEPGERKSALLGLLAASLHEWQTREREFLRHALAAYAERRRVLEARLAGVRDRCKRAKDHAEAKALELEALALAAELENLPPLSAPELVTSNTTPEALRDLLARNGEKAALVSAETDAGQLLGSRYSKTGSANVDLFLQAFTGDPAPAHRIGKDVMRAAVAWAPFLLGHFRAVLGDASEPKERKDARRLLAALKRHALADFSARDALRLCDGLRAEDAPEVLAELEDAGWIRPLPAPTPDAAAVLRGGRPASPRYAVNPSALGE